MTVTALAPTGIKSDRWLSELLGRPTWSVDPAVTTAAEAIKQAGSGPLFLYARVLANDVKTLDGFENAGFRVVDLTLTLEAPTAAIRVATPQNIRMAIASDEVVVRAIATRSFVSSRLHLDPRIPKAVADRSRGEWAGNFFHGRRGDAMVVAEDDGVIAGFLLLVVPGGAEPMTIDLIAISPETRGLGLGTQCVQFATSHFGSSERIRVGTQAANVGSLRFYARLGFKPVASQYVLHFHRV